MTRYLSYDYEKHEYFEDVNARHDHYLYIPQDDTFIETIPFKEQKIIHFVSFEPQDFYDITILKLYHGYDETLSAIERGERVIYTTQMTLMDFDLQAVYGYDILIHDNPDRFSDFYLVTYDARQCERTNKQLRRAHNILKMWIAGSFSKPRVDWSNLPIDTLIQVQTHENCAWINRFFAGYENDTVYVWDCGATSLTVFDNSKIPCYNARLYEERIIEE